MLLVNGEKMAKSAGNFTTLRDALSRAPGEVLRLLLIRTHYRSTPDFSDASINEARKELDRFYRALQRFPDAPGGSVPDQVLAALCDDVNTPLALSQMHALADAVLAGEDLAAQLAAKGLRAAGEVLGLLNESPDIWFRGDETDSAAIETAIQERLAARKARDFARADAIRSELAERGVILEDGPGGTTWRRNRQTVQDH
jgi:cysteinyl-tRNA synthetase